MLPSFPCLCIHRLSPLQSLDGATQRLLFVPRTMTQGMHRRQREHTHKGDAGQCTALSIHVGANKYLTTGEEGTYAERSNIKERTALCESVVAGAQVISHHYAITDHEQKQCKKKDKTYPSKHVYYRRGISHHSLNQSFERR